MRLDALGEGQAYVFILALTRLVLRLLISSSHHSEPQERRGVLREDAEAAPGPQPGRHHPGDDQEEGEE